MEDDRIQTLHPTGKQGVNISRQKYEQIRDFILQSLLESGQTTYQALVEHAITELEGKFEGSIPWYIVTVKLDLEARGEIERIPGTSPHLIRIRSNSHSPEAGAEK
jgi:hypothetical protein